MSQDTHRYKAYEMYPYTLVKNNAKLTILSFAKFISLLHKCAPLPFPTCIQDQSTALLKHHFSDIQSYQSE